MVVEKKWWKFYILIDVIINGYIQLKSAIQIFLKTKKEGKSKSSKRHILVRTACCLGWILAVSEYEDKCISCLYLPNNLFSHPQYQNIYILLPSFKCLKVYAMCVWRVFSGPETICSASYLKLHLHTHINTPLVCFSIRRRYHTLKNYSPHTHLIRIMLLLLHLISFPQIPERKTHYYS